MNREKEGRLPPFSNATALLSIFLLSNCHATSIIKICHMRFYQVILLAMLIIRLENAWSSEKMRLQEGTARRTACP